MLCVMSRLVKPRSDSASGAGKDTSSDNQSDAGCKDKSDRKAGRDDAAKPIASHRPENPAVVRVCDLNNSDTRGDLQKRIGRT